MRGWVVLVVLVVLVVVVVCVCDGETAGWGA